MKHTKGPWIKLDADERRGPSGHILSARIAHEDGGAIADAYANCLVTTDEQCRANARLIAAAPMLLEALMDAHATIQGLAWSGTGDEEGAMTAQLAEIEAAIVKATQEAA